MKRILAIFLFVFLFGQFILYGEEKGAPDQSPPPKPPNPLELENNWWDYFKVSPEKLPEVINTFEKHLDQALSFSPDQDREEVDTLKKEILLNLQLLKAKVNQEVPKSPPPLLLLSVYQPSQLLEINAKLIETRDSVRETKDRIAVESSRADRLQASLDKKVLQYYNLSKSSYERLIKGLEIIVLRLEIGVRREELGQLQQMLNYLVKNEELISDELKNARDKIDYSQINRDELVQEANNLNKEKEDIQRKINRLERASLYEENKKLKSEIVCCLTNYEIITETIRLEKLKVFSVINEILLALYDLSQPTEETSTTDYRKELEIWEKTLANQKKSLVNWQKQLDQDHGKISKLISDAFKESKELPPEAENSIADIHLQIDQSFALIKDIETEISGAEQLLKLLENRIVEEKSITEAWSIRVKNYWMATVETFEEITGVTVFYINEHPVTIELLIKSILTLFFAYLFSKYLQKTLSKKVFTPGRVSESTTYITLRLIHYFILILAFLLALSYLGIDLTNIFIVAGALGVGIGFGLQSLVNNIISGVTLLLNRYIKVGDIIEIEGSVMAKVTAINLQFTRIYTLDGADKIIPNSEITSRGLTNWTMKNVYRRFHVPFGVAYGTDKNFVREKILEAVKKEPYVLHGLFEVADPQIWFIRYGDSSMDFELVAWVNLAITPPYGTASSSLLWVVDNVLNRENIVVPFPQREVYIKEVPRELFQKD